MNQILFRKKNWENGGKQDEEESDDEEEGQNEEDNKKDDDEVDVRKIGIKTMILILNLRRYPMMKMY